MSLEVLRPGPLCTVQDLGRPGLAHLGVPRSGAADRPSLRAANRLVGNPEEAAGLELTLGGLVLRAGAPVVVALAGAPCPAYRDGTPAPFAAALSLAAGAELRVGTPRWGLRTYLAVRGGVAVPAVLGSRATDLLSGLGPQPLAPGTVLPVGPAPGGTASAAPLADPGVRDPAGRPRVLRLLPGPRADWFTPQAWELLTAAPYAVSPQSNRVGLRLSGPPLPRRVVGELAPEPLVEGALQVPPDGQPVLFLADHPVTGGYPVLAVVAAADLPLAAQARPGDRLAFRAPAAPGQAGRPPSQG